MQILITEEGVEAFNELRKTIKEKIEFYKKLDKSNDDITLLLDKIFDNIEIYQPVIVYKADKAYMPSYDKIGSDINVGDENQLSPSEIDESNI